MPHWRVGSFCAITHKHNHTCTEVAAFRRQYTHTRSKRRTGLMRMCPLRECKQQSSMAGTCASVCSADAQCIGIMMQSQRHQQSADAKPLTDSPASEQQDQHPSSKTSIRAARCGVRRHNQVCAGAQYLDVYAFTRGTLVGGDSHTNAFARRGVCFYTSQRIRLCPPRCKIVFPKISLCWKS